MKTTYFARRHNRLTNWHRFFCLLPRKVGLNWVWLGIVERKLVQSYAGMEDGWPYSQFFRHVGSTDDYVLSEINDRYIIAVKTGEQVNYN